MMFQRALFGLLIVLSGAFCAPAGADESASPPVMMQPVNLVETILNVKVQIEYSSIQGGPPWVNAVYVDQVKPGSIAEKAGLRNGMTILAIAGRPVAGLSQREMNALLVQPAHDHLTLRVRRGWFGKARDIELPVPSDSNATKK